MPTSYTLILLLIFSYPVLEGKESEYMNWEYEPVFYVRQVLDMSQQKRIADPLAKQGIGHKGLRSLWCGR